MRDLKGEEIYGSVNENRQENVTSYYGKWSIVCEMH
jgi:hypothetical protein